MTQNVIPNKASVTSNSVDENSIQSLTNLENGILTNANWNKQFLKRIRAHEEEDLSFSFVDVDQQPDQTLNDLDDNLSSMQVNNPENGFEVNHHHFQAEQQEDDSSTGGKTTVLGPKRGTLQPRKSLWVNTTSLHEIAEESDVKHSQSPTYKEQPNQRIKQRKGSLDTSFVEDLSLEDMNHGLPEISNEPETPESKKSHISSEEKERVVQYLKAFERFLTTGNNDGINASKKYYDKRHQEFKRAFHTPWASKEEHDQMFKELFDRLLVPTSLREELLKKPGTIYEFINDLRECLYSSSKHFLISYLLGQLAKPFDWKWIAIVVAVLTGAIGIADYFTSLATLMKFALLTKSWVTVNVLTNLNLGIIGILTTTITTCYEIYCIAKDRKLSSNAHNDNIFLAVLQGFVKLAPYILKLSGVISVGFLFSSLSIISSSISAWKEKNHYDDAIRNMRDLYKDLRHELQKTGEDNLPSSQDIDFFKTSAPIVQAQNKAIHPKHASLLAIQPGLQPYVAMDLSKQILRISLGATQTRWEKHINLFAAITTIAITATVALTGVGAIGYAMTLMVIVGKSIALKRVAQKTLTNYQEKAKQYEEGADLKAGAEAIYSKWEKELNKVKEKPNQRLHRYLEGTAASIHQQTEDKKNRYVQSLGDLDKHERDRLTIPGKKPIGSLEPIEHNALTRSKGDTGKAAQLPETMQKNDDFSHLPKNRSHSLFPATTHRLTYKDQMTKAPEDIETTEASNVLAPSETSQKTETEKKPEAPGLFKVIKLHKVQCSKEPSKEQQEQQEQQKKGP
ncbi:MAG: hypothetical protein H2069_08895 [Legionella sp.]|nr:hypothetical protein [Legionella sp.]